jgi:hypothetical protein
MPMYRFGKCASSRPAISGESVKQCTCIYRSFSTHWHPTCAYTDRMVFRHELHEDARRILLGLARVDGERLAEAHGVPELAREHGLLGLARGVVVVVVEPDLAPADAARVRHCGQPVGRER